MGFVFDLARFGLFKLSDAEIGWVGFPDEICVEAALLSVAFLSPARDCFFVLTPTRALPFSMSHPPL